MTTVRGGDKLDEALRQLRAKLSDAKTLRMGFFSEAEYTDGTSVAMVAAIQNYGAPAMNIPPRPFFSNMVKENQGQWPMVLETSLRARDLDVNAALADFGHELEGELRQSIQQTNEPPLRPGTIKRKGHSKPLVDSGTMLNSITSKVE